MSLAVWLPLNGDLHNQGLSNIIVTNNGATINNSGKIGKCYSFNGSSNYLRFQYPASNLQGQFSFCCWLKLNNRVLHTLISSRKNTGYGFSVFVLSTGQIRFDNGTDTVISQTTFDTVLPLNTWQHIAIIQTSTLRQLYINGILTESIAATPVTSGNTAQYMMMGACSVNDTAPPTGNFLAGYLNDVRIYNHCLSPKEVEEIAKGLILHYPLNQLYDNNIIYDTSGYCNNGTIVGDITTITPSPRYNCATNFINNTSGIKINNNSFSSILNLDFTFSFWIKSNDQGRSIYFGNYSKNPAFNIEKKDNNSLRLYWNGSPDIEFSNTTITNNEWVFITIVKFSTGTIKAYLNGVEKAATGYGFTSQSFSSPWYIGRDSRGDNTAYLGNMSDFRIYCTALSANQIKELYNTSMQIDSSGNVFARELVEL